MEKKIVKLENVYIGDKKIITDEEIFLNELDKIGIKACRNEIKTHENFFLYRNKEIFKKN